MDHGGLTRRSYLDIMISVSQIMICVPRPMAKK